MGENGRRVKFWTNMKGGEEASCHSFPSLQLHSLVVYKEVWVVNMCHPEGEEDI